jgi:hypothetical protein
LGSAKVRAWSIAMIRFVDVAIEQPAATSAAGRREAGRQAAIIGGEARVAPVTPAPAPPRKGRKPS